MAIKLDLNFNEVEAAEAGGFVPPPPGAYVMKVVDVSDKPSKAGNPMVTLSLDIAQGEHAGAFQKFPRKFFQLINGEHTAYFKGMLKAFKESNAEEKVRGVVVNGANGFEFVPERMKGLHVGACLGEAEYKTKDGGIGIGLEVRFLCSVAGLENVKVPALKKLAGSNGGERRSGNVGPAGATIDDDDIPF